MRMVQYFESLTQFGRAGPNPADREAISDYELAHATYGWKRQLGLHHGLYVGEAAGDHERVGKQPVVVPVPWSDLQLCQKLLLESPQCRGVLCTRDVRVWLRNKLTNRKIADIAGLLLRAVDLLCAAGVLSVSERPASDVAVVATDAACQRVKGRRVTWFEKKSWPIIEGKRRRDCASRRAVRVRGALSGLI